MPAYTFVANPEHGQYTGNLSLNQSAEMIMKAQGVIGLNRDYLMSTVQKFENEGFAEPELLNSASEYVNSPVQSIREVVFNYLFNSCFADETNTKKC